MIKYFILLAGIITLSIGQLVLKKGVLDAPPQSTITSLLHTLFNPYIILGYFFYGISSILGLYILRIFPVSVALPSMSVTYIFVVIASAYMFDEKVTTFKIIGIILITIGVLCLFKKEAI